MSEAIREAADRLRKWAANEPPLEYYGEMIPGRDKYSYTQRGLDSEIERLVMIDRRILADAYLALTKEPR